MPGRQKGWATTLHNATVTTFQGMETKMATSPRATKEELAPDQRPLTRIQAKRIGALADIAASDLEKMTIAKASDKLKWTIDPHLFLFRRKNSYWLVCF